MYKIYIKYIDKIKINKNEINKLQKYSLCKIKKNFIYKILNINLN